MNILDIYEILKKKEKFDNIDVLKSTQGMGFIRNRGALNIDTYTINNAYVEDSLFAEIKLTRINNIYNEISIFYMDEIIFELKVDLELVDSELIVNPIDRLGKLIEDIYKTKLEEKRKSFLEEISCI